MTARRLLLAAAALSVLAIAPGSGGGTPVPGPVVGLAASAALPSQLSDQEFWRLSTSLSEAGGTFHSDNFVSNEGRFQTVIPDLVRRARQAASTSASDPSRISPTWRRCARAWRSSSTSGAATCTSTCCTRRCSNCRRTARSFSRGCFPAPRPVAATTSWSAVGLVCRSRPEPSHRGALSHEPRGGGRAADQTHRLPLGQGDLDGIGYVYRTAFFADGPDLNYQLTGQAGGIGQGGTPTYAELMAMDDGAGRQRSYLANEQNFLYLKDLESRNLVVPLVGDFGGKRALRGVARYARDSGVTVGAFYLSNVEQYLRQDGKWEAFCANVAAMPLDRSSTFIRSVRGGNNRRGQTGASRFGMFTSSLGEMLAETRGCGPTRAASGRSRS